MISSKSHQPTSMYLERAPVISRRSFAGKGDGVVISRPWLIHLWWPSAMTHAWLGFLLPQGEL
jgi:hypothetical protein